MHQPFYLSSDGSVYELKNNKKTAYIVDSEGRLFLNGEEIGTIYEIFDEEKDNHLFEISTSFLQLIKSNDQGKTWSKPVDLNLQVKDEWMRFIGSGPGVGIQLKHGGYKGRLLFPMYYTNGTNFFSCGLIYSDDHGVTWQRGKSPNDGRKMDATDFSSESLGNDSHKYELTENQVVELNDGTVVLYMRNHYYKGCVCKAESHDGGQTFGEVSFVEELTNPICQFSIIKYNDSSAPEKDILVFVGPDSATERKYGTVKLSFDGGKTWPYEKCFEHGEFMYSSVTQLGNGNLGIIYEGEEEKSGLVESIYLELSLEEIMA